MIWAEDRLEEHTMTWAFWKKIHIPVFPCISAKGFDLPTSEETSKIPRKDFTFKQIDECSEGFSNLIDETVCHRIYKGVLTDGTEVAIKTLKKSPPTRMDVEDFGSQVDLYSRIHHRHLANLIGICEENHHRMLVFEYAPNGSLFSNLHNDDEPLSWKQRMRVAIGTASVMQYLHGLGGSPVIHGDLTSHNVLLTDDFSAKINGICTPSRHAKPKNDQVLVNSHLNGNLSKGPPDDVYSFGVLLLELVSGKSCFNKEFGVIVEWAGQFLQSRDQMAILADPTLKNVVPLELYSVCEIARLCIQEEAASRPRMEEVHYMLVQSLGMEEEDSSAAAAAAAAMVTTSNR